MASGVGGVVLAVVLTAGAAVAAPRPTQDKLPPGFVAAFKKIQALTADFREEKKMALLAAPLVRTGKLYYEAPGRLAQIAATPTPARLVLEGGRLIASDGSEKHAIDVNEHPAVAALLRLVLSLLAGDAGAIARETKIAFAEDKSGRWTLELVPTTELLGKLLRKLACTGRGATIDVLTVIDAGGDETVTKFSNVRFFPRLPAAARAEAFAAGP